MNIETPTAPVTTACSHFVLLTIYRYNAFTDTNLTLQFNFWWSHGQRIRKWCIWFNHANAQGTPKWTIKTPRWAHLEVHYYIPVGHKSYSIVATTAPTSVNDFPMCLDAFLLKMSNYKIALHWFTYTRLGKANSLQLLSKLCNCMPIIWHSKPTWPYMCPCLPLGLDSVMWIHKLCTKGWS